MRGKHAAKAHHRRTLKADADRAEYEARQASLRERLSIAEEAQAEALARLTDLTARFDDYRSRSAPAEAAERDADAAKARRDEVATALRRAARAFYSDFRNLISRKETKSGGFTKDKQAGQGFPEDLVHALEEVRSEFGLVERGRDRSASHIASAHLARTA